MNNIDRRGFLKLMQLLPLVFVNPPRFNYISPNDNLEEALPNILVVVFDSLSAMNMSLYGYPRHTTPNIEKAAQNAAVYHRHYAGGSFTTPGAGSLLTGVYPFTHRAMHTFGTVKDAFVDRNIFTLFNKRYATYAYSHIAFAITLLRQFQEGIDHYTKVDELCLASANYADMLPDIDPLLMPQVEELLFQRQTRLPTTHFLSRLDRSRRYFIENMVNRRYYDKFPRGVPNSTTIFFTLEDAIDWIKDQVAVKNNPSLGYVHLYPPHHPYTTRNDFINIFDDGWEPIEKPKHIFTDGYSEGLTNQQRQYYDEYIAYADAEFGRLFEFMRETGALDNTILILTSDHGEMFERGILQHTTKTLFEPVIHIPLIMWNPRIRKRIDVNSLTSCVDILPTLLHETGMQKPDWCEGEVLPPFNRHSGTSDRGIFAFDGKESPKYGHLSKGTIAIVRDPYKFIYHYGYEDYNDLVEIYNLVEDPDELQDISGGSPSLVKAFMGEAMEILRSSALYDT